MTQGTRKPLYRLLPPTLSTSSEVRLPEMALGYLVASFCAMVANAVFGSYLNRYYVDVLGWTRFGAFATLLPMVSSVLVVAASVVLKGIGIIPAQYVLLALISDVLDQLEEANGFRSDGLTMSIYSSVMVGLGGLGISLINGLLAFSGYSNVGYAVDPPQTPSSTTWPPGRGRWSISSWAAPGRCLPLPTWAST